MAPRPPRLAVRAVIVAGGRLLLVNAYPGDKTDLWCAPGGGVEAGASLPENLMREVHEECGLTIRVGPPCLVNEFHDPGGEFHQVEVFFRCTIEAGETTETWQDPARVVTRRRWVTAGEMAGLRVKPDSLAAVAFRRGMGYDPLEPILRP